MNKRGIANQQLYINGFYIILAAVIIIVLFSYISHEISGISSNQKVLAKNLGLALDSAYASNGNLELTYNLNNTFLIESNKGVLTVKNSKLGTLGFYTVAQNNKDLDFSINTGSLKIKSINGDISVNG